MPCQPWIMLPLAVSGYHGLQMLTGRKPQQISATVVTGIGRKNCHEPSISRTRKGPVARHGRTRRISRTICSQWKPARILDR